MKIDDLLGLAFLIFFVVIPAIQGVLRRNPPPQEVDPEVFKIPEPPKPQAKGPSSAPSSTPPPPSAQRPTVPSAQRPAPSAPSQPKPRPVQKAPGQQGKPQTPTPGKTLEQIERERLGRTGSRPAQSASVPSTPPQAPNPPQTPVQAQNWTLTPEPRAILNGVIWHQVLSEPRSKYWRNRRKPKL